MPRLDAIVSAITVPTKAWVTVIRMPREAGSTEVDSSVSRPVKRSVSSPAGVETPPTVKRGASTSAGFGLEHPSRLSQMPSRSESTS